MNKWERIWNEASNVSGLTNALKLFGELSIYAEI